MTAKKATEGRDSLELVGMIRGVPTQEEIRALADALKLAVKESKNSPASKRRTTTTSSGTSRPSRAGARAKKDAKG